MTGHMRVLRPHPAIYAFYDGRVPGYRFAEQKNWVDEGALALGIASYAIVSGHKALVYDTHVSVAHATQVRDVLAREAGVTDFTVLLSHWHLDHVAGTVAFDDSPIIATAQTADHLERRQTKIESGALEGPPAISPLILPTRVFSDAIDFDLGDIRLKFIEANIHSDDAAVIWWADERILFAGDTMEDTVTYVTEPEGLQLHLSDLERLDKLAPARILPNHGAPDIIEAGGYNRGLNRAAQQYIRSLIRCRTDAELREAPLQEVIRGPLANGWVTYFEPYESVHRENVEAVCSVGAGDLAGN